MKAYGGELQVGRYVDGRRKLTAFGVEGYEVKLQGKNPTLEVGGEVLGPFRYSYQALEAFMEKAKEVR